MHSVVPFQACRCVVGAELIERGFESERQLASSEEAS
jgi:hypothetical protein